MGIAHISKSKFVEQTEDTMLYHASQQSGIKELVPHASTHGKKYVYAINNRLTAILFGVPKDDFDILLDEVDGKPAIFECYPNALRKIYFEKTCYLYVLNEEGFLSNQTGWEPEMICEHSVPVVSEEKIKNIYNEIIDSICTSDCIFHEYSTDEKYQAFLKDELSERVMHFGITDEQMDTDPRFELYFNSLLER